MTAAEQARAEVEAWLRDDNGFAKLHAGYGFDDLVARLTPVFERAQASNYPCCKDHNCESPEACLAKQRDALRERAERAEASAVFKRDCLLSGAKVQEQMRARYEAAEADVARLREALTQAEELLRFASGLNCSTGWARCIRCDSGVILCRILQALASTEPKR